MIKFIKNVIYSDFLLIGRIVLFLYMGFTGFIMGKILYPFIPENYMGISNVGFYIGVLSVIIMAFCLLYLLLIFLEATITWMFTGYFESNYIQDIVFNILAFIIHLYCFPIKLFFGDWILYETPLKTYANKDWFHILL